MSKPKAPSDEEPNPLSQPGEFIKYQRRKERKDHRVKWVFQLFINAYLCIFAMLVSIIMTYALFRIWDYDNLVDIGGIIGLIISLYTMLGLIMSKLGERRRYESWFVQAVSPYSYMVLSGFRDVEKRIQNVATDIRTDLVDLELHQLEIDSRDARTSWNDDHLEMKQARAKKLKLRLEQIKQELKDLENSEII